MFLWFIGTAVVSVWYVFRDPRFDYRLLAIGALLPDVIDLPGGHARWAHSLTVAVGALVLRDGGHGRAQADSPTAAGRADRDAAAPRVGRCVRIDRACSGGRSPGRGGSVRVPSLQRGWLNIAFEAAGALLLAWMWRRCELADAARRKALIRHGLLMQPPS